MSERVVWDKYETALLIDMFWLVERKEISKSDACKLLSKQLRQMAINEGREVDELYRNYNGMVLQMTAIEKLFFPERNGLKEPSKLFKEIAELYITNRVEFNNILKIAKEKLEGPEMEVLSLREKFNSWLFEKGVKIPPVSEILKAFDLASEYAIKRNICKTVFWEMRTTSEFNSVRAKLLGMRLFRMTYPNAAKILDKSWRFYFSFLGEMEEINGGHDGQGTQPLNNETESASDGYIRNARDKTLSAMYPSLFPMIYEFLKAHKDGYSVLELQEELNSTKENSKYRTTTVITVLDNASWAIVQEGKYYFKPVLSEEPVVFEASVEIDSSIETIEEPIQEESKDDYSPIIEDDEDEMPNSEFLERFGEWMRKKGIAEATVRSYVSAVNVADHYAKEHNFKNVSLISTDFRVIINSIEALLSNKEFIEFNARQHNRFSAAFRKLRDFISETERFAFTNSIDAEMEIKHPDLYNKLHTMSKVYVGDPNGLSVEYISMIFNYSCDEIIEILDNVSWAKKKIGGTYIFGDFSEKVEAKNEIEVLDDFSKERFIEVLLRRFRSGMLFDSIDYDNFRDTYFDLFDEKLSFTDEELEDRLKGCGLEYNGRLFPAEGIIDNNTAEKVFDYIENTFLMGSKILYYKAIYSDLSDVLEYCYSLVDSDMLRSYLKFKSEPEKYYFYEQYMSKEENVKVDNSAEIEEFMLNAGKPLSYEDVYEGLSHISQDIIYNEIRSNAKYIMNEKEHYFHIDIFEFSSLDREKFVELFNSEIKENGYVIWSRMYSCVTENMPAFIENNAYLSLLGIRNALSYHMNTEFSFDGNVISLISNKLDMSEVFRLYAKHNTPFTADDIYNFAKEVGTTIYYLAIADVAVRVSKELFVAKEAVHFDIDAIDGALETYLSQGYILIKEVDSFLVFPYVGFEWNEFLLESYLLHYSKKFCLVNNGISLNNVPGAIAKKDGEYTRFIDICIHAIAESDIELNKTTALDYLVAINLLTKKSYKEIDVVLNKARQLRNKRG